MNASRTETADLYTFGTGTAMRTRRRARLRRRERADAAAACGRECPDAAASRADGRLGLGERFLTPAHVLFVALCALQALPNAAAEDPHTFALLVVVAGLELVYVVMSALMRTRGGRDTTNDVMCVIYVVLGAWTLATAKFDVLSDYLFSAPGTVFAQIYEDGAKIVEGIVSSMGIVLQGYVMGALCALTVGLALGWSARSRRSTEKVVSFLSAIPPVVYIPYAIALLPTFRSASVLVIFLATFWPTLTGTLAGVSSVDRRAIDSARVLNVGTLTMLLRVVLPGSLPLVFNGLNIGLCLSFILLTSAEMIGGSTGMGFYVKYYSDYGDYTRILAGIIVIGVVITAVSLLFGKLQRYLLRWQ